MIFFTDHDEIKGGKILVDKKFIQTTSIGEYLYVFFKKELNMMPKKNMYYQIKK